MALINCPECKKEVSDAAKNCPHCGYPINQQKAEVVAEVIDIALPDPTPLGPIEKHVGRGIVLIVIGIFALVLGLVTIGLIVGIFVTIGAIICLFTGYGDISGMRKVTCPHCKKQTISHKDIVKLKCSTCKKISVVDGDYLKPVP